MAKLAFLALLLLLASVTPFPEAVGAEMESADIQQNQINSRKFLQLGKNATSKTSVPGILGKNALSRNTRGDIPCRGICLFEPDDCEGDCACMPPMGICSGECCGTGGPAGSTATVRNLVFKNAV